MWPDILFHRTIFSRTTPVGAAVGAFQRSHVSTMIRTGLSTKRSSSLAAANWPDGLMAADHCRSRQVVDTRGDQIHRIQLQPRCRAPPSLLGSHHRTSTPSPRLSPLALTRARNHHRTWMVVLGDTISHVPDAPSRPPQLSPCHIRRHKSALLTIALCTLCASTHSFRNQF
jgi:hypothetical protein